jgi:hypothetical protein
MVELQFLQVEHSTELDQIQLLFIRNQQIFKKKQEEEET